MKNKATERAMECCEDNGPIPLEVMKCASRYPVVAICEKIKVHLYTVPHLAESDSVQIQITVYCV